MDWKARFVIVYNNWPLFVLLSFLLLGPTAWPPRSPDLTIMDFFVWGMVKSDVYRFEATTKENMMERIQQSFRRITPAMLREVRASLSRRFNLCL